MPSIVVKDLNKFQKERTNTYIDLELDLIVNYTNSKELKGIQEQKDIRADYDSNAIKNSLYNLFTTMLWAKNTQSNIWIKSVKFYIQWNNTSKC